MKHFKLLPRAVLPMILSGGIFAFFLSFTLIDRLAFFYIKREVLGMGHFMQSALHYHAKMPNSDTLGNIFVPLYSNVFITDLQGGKTAFSAHNRGLPAGFSLMRLLKRPSFKASFVFYTMNGQIGIIHVSAPYAEEVMLRRIVILSAIFALTVMALGFLCSIFLFNRFLIAILKELETAVQSGLTQSIPAQSVKGMKSRIAQLAQRSQEFNALFNAVQDPIMIINANGDLEQLNRAAASWLKVAGYGWQDSHKPAFMELLRLHGILKNSEKNFIKNHNVTVSSGAKTYAAYISILPHKKRLLYMHDISQIARVDQMRREYVSNVSHELKTPIAAIKGFTEILSDTNLDAVQRAKFLKIINRESDRLIEIIDGLMMISRLEERKEGLEKELFPVEDLLQSVIAAAGIMAKEKQMVLEVHVKESMQVLAHPSLIEEAVLGLTVNAVRYCPEKTHIQLSAYESDCNYYIAVQDNGPCINKHEQKRIFERFYRSSNTGRSRESGGSGLGLAIIKHIMLAHNGDVVLISQEGLGARFVLELPKR